MYHNEMKFLAVRIHWFFFSIQKSYWKNSWNEKVHKRKINWFQLTCTQVDYGHFIKLDGLKFYQCSVYMQCFKFLAHARIHLLFRWTYFKISRIYVHFCCIECHCAIFRNVNRIILLNLCAVSKQEKGKIS